MDNKLRINKSLKIQTLIILSLLCIFIITEIYCIFFQWYNDNKKESYDIAYLEEILNSDIDLFNCCIRQMQNEKILLVSHNKNDINNFDNSYLKNTLYYECAEYNKEKNDTSYIEKVFDKYDFDTIEESNGIISFTFYSPSIQLTYSKHKMKDCKNVSDCWYVGYLL